MRSSPSPSHSPYPLNVSACTVSVGFFEDMWIPLVHLPQPCALYVSIFSLFYFHFMTNSTPPTFFTALHHHPVIPTNAHISGFRAPRQRRLTNCSTLPNPSGFTSTKARSCAYEWRGTNSVTMSRAHRKRPRVSTSADQLGVYHTLSP